MNSTDRAFNLERLKSHLTTCGKCGTECRKNYVLSFENIRVHPCGKCKDTNVDSRQHLDKNNKVSEKNLDMSKYVFTRFLCSHDVEKIYCRRCRAYFWFRRIKGLYSMYQDDLQEECPEIYEKIYLKEREKDSYFIFQDDLQEEEYLIECDNDPYSIFQDDLQEEDEEESLIECEVSVRMEKKYPMILQPTSYPSFISSREIGMQNIIVEKLS